MKEGLPEETEKHQSLHGGTACLVDDRDRRPDQGKAKNGERVVD